MAVGAVRLDFRIDLSHVDRGIELSDEKVVLARHPSEAADHVILRVIAYCLFHEEGLAFGPGLGEPEAADLWTKDPGGRITTWIECGAAPFDKLKKVVQHNTGVAVHALFSDARRREDLVGAARDLGPRASKVAGAISIWTVDPKLVAELAKNEERRQRWAVTIVGDHLYVEIDGVSLDGALVRERLPEA